MVAITVKRGETLSKIGRRHGVTVAQLQRANPSIVDVNRIQIGQRLALPGERRTQREPPMPFLNAEATGTLNAPLTESMNDDTEVTRRAVYAPGSPEQIALFQEAARRAGLPESWASSRGIAQLLRRESGGVVGKPNYTYGNRANNPAQWGAIHDELRRGRKTAKSSATGLGQLLLRNVERYYPDGRRGIGDPLNEAIGMMRYIKDRYGNPDAAWAAYGRNHEGY